MSLTELIEPAGEGEQSDLQLDAGGRLRHLLTLQGLDRRLLTALLDDAESYLSEPGRPAVRTEARNNFV